MLLWRLGVLLWSSRILLWSPDSVALDILVDHVVPLENQVIVYIVILVMLIIVPLPSATGTSWNNLMANNLLL